MNALGRARLVNGGLAVLALVLLIVVAVTSRAPSRAELELRERHVLTVFPEDELEQVVVTRGDERVVIERAAPGHEEPPRGDEPLGIASDWRLLEPFETAADDVAVERLVGSLQHATWLRRLEPDEAAGVAFAPDALRIELDLGARRYALRLGPESPTPAGSRYLEVVGEEELLPQSAGRSVGVVAEGLVSELDRAPASYRGRALSPYSRRTLRSLSVASSTDEYRVERAGEVFHVVRASGAVRADRAALDRVFLALARMTAEPLLPLEAARAAREAAADASVEITLEPRAEAQPTARLVIGGECPGHTGRVVALRREPEPLAGCVDASVATALAIRADDLLDRGLFSAALDELERFASVEGERQLELSRKGEGFVLLAPRQAPLESEAVEDRLERVLAIRGALIEPRPPPLPEDQAALVVRVALAGTQDAEEVVRVGPKQSDGRFIAQRASDGAALAIDAEARALLAPDATLLKPLAVFDYAPAEVRAVSIERAPTSPGASDGVEQRFTRSEAGELSLVQPRGYEIDGGLALEALDRLRQLRALRWVTDRDSDDFGLADPRLTAELEIVREGRTIVRTLHIGQRAPGGFYAKVDRDPGVFVAPAALERALSTWLVDRSVFAVALRDVRRVVLDAGARGRLELVQSPGGLVSEVGSRALEPSEIDAVAEVLEGLRPERAVHLGAPRRGDGLQAPELVVRVEQEAGRGDASTLVWRVGGRDTLDGASIYYARSSAADATYALPRAPVQRLLDLF